MDEALQVIRDKLHNDKTLSEWSTLQDETIMELLEIYLRTIYFQVDGKFFQQKDGMAMGRSLSSVMSNMFMEHSEKLVFDMVQY